MCMLVFWYVHFLAEMQRRVHAGLTAKMQRTECNGYLQRLQAVSEKGRPRSNCGGMQTIRVNHCKGEDC